jgi:Domain of unknown function (DUF4166)/Saccharopine dehydrogenase NADP binding domain
VKILIVGGYGTFGGRLVDLLLNRPELTLVVAGRNLGIAQAFCKKRSGSAAKLEALQFDRSQPGAALATIKPFLVVDASGPFQIYDGDAYVLVRAAIAVRSNYLDLADGAAFVQGISAMDAAANAAGVFVLSGMSSFPVLTAAVGKVLAKDLDQVDRIEAGIAPSPYAGVGLNVIRAIASYAGQPVELLQNGTWTTAVGFFDSRRLQVAVPGKIPLAPIRFALAEVPDLKVLSWVWPQARSIWMGAGPTPAILHRLLWGAAGLVKLGLLRSLLPLAPIMSFVVNTVRWGEHRGGFVLQMAGTKDGKLRHLSWHLLAEGDGGPLIPSMAAATIVERCLKDERPPVGARSGHNDITLEDYEVWFDRYGIATGARDDDQRGRSIYEVVLGSAFQRLDAPLRAFHSAMSSFKMKGQAEIITGGGWAGTLIRKIFGFPAAKSDCPLEFDLTISAKGEVWQRRFAGKLMQSIQSLGSGADSGLIVERFGPVAVGMAVVEANGQLHLVLRHWRAFGVPMPKWLMPRGQFFEHGADDRFNFHVEIALPFIGSIVTYRGWLA